MRKDNLYFRQNQDTARTPYYKVSGRAAKSSGDYSEMSEERGHYSTGLTKDKPCFSKVEVYPEGRNLIPCT